MPVPRRMKEAGSETGPGSVTATVWRPPLVQAAPSNWKVPTFMIDVEEEEGHEKRCCPKRAKLFVP